ncbi:alpha/beta hydrolase family protein [Rhizoctonia solani]|uniref:Alpha/beta hydrolase family protein n=1 Tax=Rhizoctonia solani TaxID=456999 RepID=A0A8H8SY21_9AGAM|nr:alpha/beta hydrolase family protein [Rhizoctonia solani]QRW22736.1 alpha/beta hydrolase family protein [Rhizoctonia solani]
MAMARGYSEKAKLIWSVPPEYVIPPNPDPNDPKLPKPPSGTHRHYLSTPAGHLEVLYALPNHKTIDSPAEESWKSPVLFLHGGFGSANCYSNFLPRFAERGHPVYSLSLRGHGRSWRPSYWALYFTPKQVLADDVAAGLKFIRERHPNAGPTTLVGHSSGGGLSQHVIDSGKGEGVGKLVVLAGIPSFGGQVLFNHGFLTNTLIRLHLIDGEFISTGLSLILGSLSAFYGRLTWVIGSLYHPRSPLSSTRLVHRAFFSPTYPIGKVQEFEAEMSPFESMSWPSGMMFPFVSRKRLLSKLTKLNARAPLLTIGGAQDKLVSVPIMRRLAHLYAATSVGIHAAGHAVTEKKFRFKDVSSKQDGFVPGVTRTENEREKEQGKIWFAEIKAPGAGHNLMRDDGWERCANVIEAFLDEEL